MIRLSPWHDYILTAAPVVKVMGDIAVHYSQLTAILEQGVPLPLVAAAVLLEAAVSAQESGVTKDRFVEVAGQMYDAATHTDEALN